ncbi:MAG: aldo/keto reductase [Bacteroidales bacterium]|nr:aldo/keto reductase [Bacteroidales bacterium]
MNNTISRRRFLEMLGLGLAATAVGCKSNKEKGSDLSKAGLGEMTYRTNHNTGDSVSILGYGMMRLPTKKETIDGNEVESIDQEAVNDLVDYAMAHGVNYYDTSPRYCQGHSETATGIALARHPRDKYYIATKMSNFDPESQTREGSIAMFENSLKSLQTDYIDYMLLHSIGGGGMENFNKRFIDNGIFDFLKEQRQNGKVRNLGFSYHGDIEVFDTMLQWMDEGRVHWDFVQIQLNYVDWNNAKDVNTRNTDAEYLYGELAKRDIPAVIMEPLLGGRLANVPDNVAAKMKQRDPEGSIASWAFRFAGNEPGVLTVLSGMTYMDHLKDNLRTYSPLIPLTDEEKEFLAICAHDYLDNKLIPCTDCKYCMPCPYGLDIPGIFAHYNKCINEDNTPRDRRDPRYAAARRAFLIGYDRAIPEARQASRCIQCDQCAPHCPQEIKIPQEMANIADYTDRLKHNKIS